MNTLMMISIIAAWDRTTADVSTNAVKRGCNYFLVCKLTTGMRRNQNFECSAPGHETT